MRRRKRISRGGLLLGGLLLLLAPTPACNDGTLDGASDGTTISARQIAEVDELIGGPSARGAVGDFIIENEKVRFIIAGKRHSMMGGPFGGTLLDADRVRTHTETRYGQGWDSFSEAFPLVNLVVANPNLPGRQVSFGGGAGEVALVPSDIEVVKDGADGEAIVRVSGRSGYVFELLKFLNKDFLGAFLAEPLEIMGLPPMPIDELLYNLFQVNIYSLLNRLQLDFQFTNEYILHEGEDYLTIRTTLVTAPPSDTRMAACPEVTCDLSCEHGFALQEVELPTDPPAAVLAKAMCPACACADPAVGMTTLNEAEDIFKIMLGGLAAWKDPAWKGGLLSGDFLFFGNETNLFAPGLGFDESRRIFENMWQGAPSLAAPLTFDWLGAVADNVSYGWATRNPDRREGADCPTWRLAIVDATYDVEPELIEVLQDQLGYGQDAAESKARNTIVNGQALVLKEGIPIDASAAFEDWKASVLASETLPVEPDDTDAVVASLFPPAVRIDLIPALECQSSKLIIPIFTTSATAVMTHKSPPALDVSSGTPTDTARTFTFERYMIVGDGDVASLLPTVYELRGVTPGHLEGVVMDEGTGTPVQHASVLAVRDPRQAPGDPKPATYDELIAQNKARFGVAGIVSQLQTDRGLDENLDGDFGGQLEAGSYFLVAFAHERGVSAPVHVDVAAGETAVAHLAIPRYGTIHYRVDDVGGMGLPCRLTFQPLDADGQTMKWEGINRVELGGPRYDHGIMDVVHSRTGEGEIELPAGEYDIWVSRGFEYSIDHIEGFRVLGGQTVTLTSALVHEVDTEGYLSGDLHVHARPSIDSGLPLDVRVLTYIAEGVEFAVATDHDILTQYQPFVNEMELQHFLTSAVGVETTTLEIGHFNGYPMQFDGTDLPVFDAPPWYGFTVGEFFENMRDRVQDGVSPDDFVVQVNHPRDGMMGYFDQLGITSWDLERDTSGLEMCNPQTELAACDFDAVEVMNEKRFELLHTPTVLEKERHNMCLQEIFGATSVEPFAVNEADPNASVCGWLQLPPGEGCGTAAAELEQLDASTMEYVRLASFADHCAWHERFRASLAECATTDLVSCKRLSLEALKLLSVRYQIERMPEEQEAFFANVTETDVGCDYEKAMEGCEPNLDNDGNPRAGCGSECWCQPCVCAAHPECCETPADGGTGWVEACAGWCESECHGCGLQPCASLQQPLQDWMAFLNWGFVVTAVGNSDSHDTKKEAGLPRNFIASPTDYPVASDPLDLIRSIKQHRVVVSTGPFIRFHIGDKTVGDTVTTPGGQKLALEIEVQTASWFGVDHVEIYRNGILERIFRVAPAAEAIVDFDQTVQLDLPTEDSWYVVVAYGLGDEYLLDPIYKRPALGQMLLPTVIAMGASSILASFSDLTEQLGGVIDLEDLLAGAIGAEELPDSYPMLPFAITNPIWVDLAGDGFEPPNGVDADGDGEWDLPPFCSVPCEVELVDDGTGAMVPGQSTCGLNQTCVPDGDGATTGMCAIPIGPTCVGSQAGPRAE